MPYLQGTTSDGISPREREHLPKSQFHSCSIPYCKQFYAEAPVRQFHFYFIQLLFGTKRVDPVAISEKLKLRCCDGDHGKQCEELLTRVKDYLVTMMFINIEAAF
jgi:hypothetical protein